MERKFPWARGAEKPKQAFAPGKEECCPKGTKAVSSHRVISMKRLRAIRLTWAELLEHVRLPLQVRQASEDRNRRLSATQQMTRPICELPWRR